MSDILPITPTSSVNSTVPVAESKELGKYEFLKILAAEMQNQDPTNPTSNTEFISQLAQFTSLEQMQNISDALNASLLMQSAGLIGKSALVEDGIQGKVESILVDSQI